MASSATAEESVCNKWSMYREIAPSCALLSYCCLFVVFFRQPRVKNGQINSPLKTVLRLVAKGCFDCWWGRGSQLDGMSNQSTLRPFHRSSFTTWNISTIAWCWSLWKYSLWQMDVLINGKPVDALSCIVHTDKAQRSGRALCSKLHDSIPRLFTFHLLKHFCSCHLLMCLDCWSFGLCKRPLIHNMFIMFCLGCLSNCLFVFLLIPVSGSFLRS